MKYGIEVLYPHPHAKLGKVTKDWHMFELYIHVQKCVWETRADSAIKAASLINRFSFQMQDLIFEIPTVETFAAVLDGKPPTNLEQKAQMMTMHSRSLNSKI